MKDRITASNKNHQGPSIQPSLPSIIGDGTSTPQMRKGPPQGLRRPRVGPLKSAAPELRESGGGIVGMGISPRKIITPARIARMVHKLGLTVTQFQNWSGFRTKDWCSNNPTWTERQFFDLLNENLELVKLEAES